MEKPDYEFPEQIDRTDWMLIWGCVGVSVVLVVLCMLGVIS